MPSMDTTPPRNEEFNERGDYRHRVVEMAVIDDMPPLIERYEKRDDDSSSSSSSSSGEPEDSDTVGDDDLDEVINSTEVRWVVTHNREKGLFNVTEGPCAVIAKGNAPRMGPCCCP